MTEASIYDFYKDRENTKINLIIYGSSGFSAVSLYLMASNLDKPAFSNIFVASLFLTSLLLSVCSFYYWYAADYLAYAEYESVSRQEKNVSLLNRIRKFQTETAARCFIHIIGAYALSFFAVMISFTKTKLILLDQPVLEISSWIFLPFRCSS